MGVKMITVTVRDKMAFNAARTRYVCGNSDYVIRFDFDEEWEAFGTKTARFVYAGGYQEKVFTGNECPVPIIGGVAVFEVGVYAGNLCTTTPAIVPAIKSILCKDGPPADPEPDVYNQMMEVLNANAEVAQGTAEKLTEAFGDGGLFLVKTLPGLTADRTQEEVREAVKAGKTCLLVYDDGEVYSYAGESDDSIHDETDCPTFLRMEYKEGTGIRDRWVRMYSDGQVIGGYSTARTPNPFRLTIQQGDTTTTYDGSKAVVVKVEAGLPETAEPDSQLVTDAEGNVVWAPRMEAAQADWDENDSTSPSYIKARTHYEAYELVTILEEEIALAEEDGLMMGLITNTFSLKADHDYTVHWNGTAYKVKAFNNEGSMLLGNYGLLMGGEGTGEPFIIMGMTEEQEVNAGYYGMVVALDGTAQLTLKITYEGIVIHKLDDKYINFKQPDWNANKGEEGYIANKTHYIEDCGEYELELGDVAGKDSFLFSEANATAYKVSDTQLPSRAKSWVSLVFKNTTTNSAMVQNVSGTQGFENGMEWKYVKGYGGYVVVNNTDLASSVLGTTVPSTGTYLFIISSDYDYIKADAHTIYHQLDIKYVNLTGYYAKYETDNAIDDAIYQNNKKYYTKVEIDSLLNDIRYRIDNIANGTGEA